MLNTRSGLRTLGILTMENVVVEVANSFNHRNALENSTNNQLHLKVLKDIENTQKELLTALHTLA